MGCINSKPELECFEEKYFHQFELSIGLSSHHSKQIDFIFHKFSFNNLLNSFQLDRAVKTLKLNLLHTSHFFEYFLESGKYCSKKLTTLGILLGKGSFKEKSELLFQNYDENLSDSLEISEIDTMLSDIVRISCEYITGFVGNQNAHDEDLKRLNKKIRTVINYLIHQFRERLMGEETRIDKKTFALRLEKMAEVILQPAEIRKECLDIYQKNLKPLELVIQRYDNKEINRSYILRRHCSISENCLDKRQIMKTKTI